MKKLKLKKKVKVITTLLSFGMLLTVLPSMKLVAEDDTVATDTSDVTVGPYIKYRPAEDTYYSDEVSNDADFTTLEANGGTPVPTDDSTKLVVNKDGSYTYNGSVSVDKTITKETKKNEINQDEDVYKLDMSASSLSKIVNYNAGVDYILLLDVSDNMKEENGYDRMAALKTALTTFINQVYNRSSGSRIALVQFSKEAKVLTNSTGTADESALVTVKTGKDDLLEIINGSSTNNTSGLGVDSIKDSMEYSNSDQAMFDALKIFQSVSTADDHKDDLNIKYSDRTRVTILFSAGLPGLGKNNSASESASTGWDITARNSAQATMSLATILKYGEKNADGTYATKVFSNDENNSKVADSSSWSTLSSKYENLSYVGCGSTVYTVGLNLPIAKNPAEITTKALLDDFADLNYSYYRDKTFVASGGLKISTRQAALVNEYLYRVSSHRTTGEHYTYDNVESSFKELYDSLGNNYADISHTYNDFNYSGTYNLQNLYGTTLYYFYPDAKTRNQTNGYFLTAEDGKLDRLTEIFNQIAQQVGSTYEGLSVRDYIDSAFVPVSVDENGVIHELSEGDTVGTSSDGKYVGTLKKDETKGWYIEWADVKLSPESSANKGDAKTFNESIYVKPVDGMIGGNNLYTNTSDSGVYIGEENKFPFPQPTVDISIDYTLSNVDQNIYLTNTVNILDMIKNLPNGKNNKGVTIVYTVMDAVGNQVGQYTILPGESSGTWNEGFDGMITPDSDQNYTITCTITTSVEDTDHSKTDTHHVHADVDYSTNKDTSANINVFKPELTYKDLSIFYGEDKPDYSSALTQTLWKHNDTKDTEATMNGNQPGLNLVYFDSDDASGNSTVAFPTKKEYQVGVNVFVGDRDITDYVSFERNSCKPSHENETLDTDNKKKFIVHIESGSLTINKTGGKEGETYVFKVKKDSLDYTEVSITVDASGNGSVTISELPIGNYSVEEDSVNGLAWRYSPTYKTDNSEISSTNPNITIECKNVSRNDKWLSKISTVITNTFTEITE